MTREFELYRTPDAKAQIAAIEKESSKKGLAKQLGKALNHLSRNPFHPGLSSHPMLVYEKLYGAKVFSSYVQNNTPQAHRILWTYGPGAQQITILAVIPHY